MFLVAPTALFPPLSIRELGLNSSDPLFANWEYRIACHRLKVGLGFPSPM